MIATNLEFASGAMLPIHCKWIGFGVKQRIDFYVILRILIENRRSLRDALGQIIEMDNDGATTPSAYLRCVSALAEQLDAGVDFDVAIRPLVPLTEAQLIRSGLNTGDLPMALSECILALESDSKMMGAVIGASTYPVGLLGIFYFVLGIFSEKVVPPFERLIPVDQWEGSAGMMYAMIEIFRSGGPPIAMAVVCLIALIAFTLPMQWGAMDGMRGFLDRYVPPWTIYRMTAGTAFLKTLAAQVKASMKIDTILSEMALNSSPWLRTRLDAISEGMAAGKSLGEAMSDSGYDFPDKRAVKILKTLSSSEGFETAVASFAARWEESTVKRVQAAAKLSVVGSTLVMGLLTGMLFLGIQELSDQVEQQAAEVTSRA